MLGEVPKADGTHFGMREERMRSKLTGMSYDSKEWEPSLQDIEAEKVSMLEALAFS